MSLMPYLMVYLAGPMDDVSKQVARGWREKLATGAPVGVAFFSPAHAYLNVNPRSFPAVDQLNRVAIQGSHAMIANLGGQGRGFGTIREIEYALQVHTPVWLIGDVGPSLMTYDLRRADSPDEALTAILETVDDLRQKVQRSPFGMLFPPFGEQEQ